MERLTKFDRTKGYYVSATGRFMDIVQRLAAYEDTGLDPEKIMDLKNGVCLGCSVPSVSEELRHMQDLLEAEKDGRLVELPDGEDNAALAATIDGADRIKTWSGGNRDLMIGLLSLLAGKVADQIGTTYKDLLLVMMAEPPILACQEAEAALGKEDKP